MSIQSMESVSLYSSHELCGYIIIKINESPDVYYRHTIQHSVLGLVILIHRTKKRRPDPTTKSTGRHRKTGINYHIHLMR